MSLKAYNAVLQYGDTADYATATAWTSVASVESIKPPEVEAQDIDVTTLTSPDEFEEMIAGLAGGGELEATVQYDKTAIGTLLAFFRTVKSWRIKYSDNSGWKWNGYLKAYGDEEVVNGEIVRTKIKIKVTGKPVQDENVLS